MTIYYVDGTKADDTGNGLSEATAKKTIAAGYALMVGGDKLYIKASTSYILTAAISMTMVGDPTVGPVEIEGYTSVPGARDGRPSITQTTTSLAVFSTTAASGYTNFTHLHITHAGATRGFGIIQPSGTGLMIKVRDCSFYGCSSAVGGSSGSITTLVVIGCEMQACTGNAINILGTSVTAEVIGCYVHDNTGDGFRFNGTSVGRVSLERNVFARNNNGFYDQGTNRTPIFRVINNVFHQNSGSGFRSDEVGTGTVQIGLLNNIFYDNNLYGIMLADAQTETDARAMFNRNNYYGANDFGDYNLISPGTDDGIISGNPFTNPAAGDYSLNTVAGAALRAKGFPTGWITAPNTNFLDIGAGQSGGGSTSLAGSGNLSGGLQ